MALQLFGLRDHPDAFPVSKTMDKWEDCSFILDFSRPIQKVRQLFRKKVWFGITAGILVPVVHVGEDKGGFIIGVNMGDPYFKDLQKLWKKHQDKQRTVRTEKVSGLQLVADFAKNFPDDAKSTGE